MRHFRQGVRGSALWGKGSSGVRLRTLIASVLAITALAVPSTAFAEELVTSTSSEPTATDSGTVTTDSSTDAAMEAFLTDVYADTSVDTSSDSSSDVSWSDVSWDDVSWSDVSWSD